MEKKSYFLPLILLFISVISLIIWNYFNKSKENSIYYFIFSCVAAFLSLIYGIFAVIINSEKLSEFFEKRLKKSKVKPQKINPEYFRIEEKLKKLTEKWKKLPENKVEDYKYSYEQVQNDFKNIKQNDTVQTQFELMSVNHQIKRLEDDQSR